ncbi:hypothetical protein BC343_16305 [Mucilaginibacter pedocola]|uniref:Beta-xylanase n=2 Tax=Mucilaginibacter pedocola TaxID=1792845 RepID=A0A1S9P8G0_9SPHI|nr:hypothetical protein BC343_16305 [Mucilaginibacter pedocola]
MADTTVQLKRAYRNYFPIGTAVDSKMVTDPRTASFIAKQYSSVTPVNDMKPVNIHPSENVYKWAPADKIVNFAVQNGLKVRGHCLVWFYRMPHWFFWDNGQLASKELLYSRLDSHINTVMSRYKGKVYAYDVLNETVAKTTETTQYSRIDTLYKIAGEDYIEHVFRTARKADPSAKLFYNDTFYDEAKRDKIYAFLKEMKAKGVPIDGVGIQCHIGIDGMSEELLSNSIDMFAKLGLEVQITELDVSIFNREAKAKTVANDSDDYTIDKEGKQSDIFNMVFKVCRQRKGVVTGITTWAPADINNYLTKRLGKRNYPNLFDNNLKPKPMLRKITDFKAGQ